MNKTLTRVIEAGTAAGAAVLALVAVPVAATAATQHTSTAAQVAPRYHANVLHGDDWKCADGPATALQNRVSNGDSSDQIYAHFEFGTLVYTASLGGFEYLCWSGLSNGNMEIHDASDVYGGDNSQKCLQWYKPSGSSNQNGTFRVSTCAGLDSQQFVSTDLGNSNGFINVYASEVGNGYAYLSGDDANQADLYVWNTVNSPQQWFAVCQPEIMGQQCA